MDVESQAQVHILLCVYRGHGTPILLKGDPERIRTFTYSNRNGGLLTHAGGVTFWKRNGPIKDLCVQEDVIFSLQIKEIV